MNQYEAIGCIHIHSVFSDGSGTIPEIVAAGQACGLDFLMLSDHMTLAGRRAGYGGWQGRLFLEIGYEIQDVNDQHHYLAFGLQQELPVDYGPEKYIRAVEEFNGLGVVAHPFEQRTAANALPGYPPIPWGRLDYPEIKVIEIWNMMSHWLERTTVHNKYWNAFHPRSLSTNPTPELLSWWDEVNLQRKVTGIGSVDVHATKVKVLGLFPKVIFDYKVMFKSIRTHLLLARKLQEYGPASEAQQAIFTAIRNGQAFISNYRWGDATGFHCHLENANGSVGIGEELIGSSALLIGSLPIAAEIRLISNGNLKAILPKQKKFEFRVEPGVYRLEVWRDGRGWIFTNHLRLKEKLA
jgi:hypothetical protein